MPVRSWKNSKTLWPSLKRGPSWNICSAWKIHDQGTVEIFFSSKNLYKSWRYFVSLVLFTSARSTQALKWSTVKEPSYKLAQLNAHVAPTYLMSFEYKVCIKENVKCSKICILTQKNMDTKLVNKGKYNSEAKLSKPPFYCSPFRSDLCKFQYIH